MVACGVLIILSLLSQSFAEDPWYYPDESDRRAVLTDNLRLSGALVLEVDDSMDLAAHPSVASVEWLSYTPRIAKITLRANADELSLSREFHQRPDVQWAHPDFVLDLTLHAMPNDPFVPDQWHLENTGQAGAPGVDINAEEAWAITAGAGQIISIIDTGVDLTHPDLIGFSGDDYVENDDDSYPSSGEGHGTACAGLAAAIGNNEQGGAGVAYEAEVYGVRLLGGETTISDTYASVTSSVDAGASVLSNSWGFTNSCEGYSLPAMYTKALDYAEEEGRGGLGTVVLQAAGNDNCDISGDGLLAYKTVVAVAAHSSDDSRESYSSYGTPIDITAPSGGLITTDIAGEAGYGSYAEDENYTGGMSGTSAATPVAAGVFALMFAANERLTAAQARDVVCQTATRNDILDADFDESGWSPYHGCGRIDAGAAVRAVANTAPEAPSSTMTVSEVYEDRIWLDWAPATDADNDPLRYRIELWTDSSELVELTPEGLSIEVTEYAQAGDLLTWRIQAIDRWGEGIWSTEETLQVVARPLSEETPVEEPTPGGCQSSFKGFWWAGIALLAARRKKDSASKSPA